MVGSVPWLLAALALPQQPAGTPVQRGVADPAYAADGRLAVSIDGDLWVRAAGERASWLEITSGAAVDREPVWTADGAALVFTSSRSGQFRLWRVGIGPAGATAAPQRVTTSTEWEGEPTIAPDGDLVFVRGRGSQARLMLRDAAGSERRLLVRRDGAEHWPAYAPDGRRIAYVTTDSGGSTLRIRWLDGDSTTVVFARRAVERPAWSPAGDRLAFAVRRGERGTWLASPDGAYANLASVHPAAVAWSPDGATLALAELPAADAGYNGDPNRVGARELADTYPGSGRLWFLPVPPPPDAGLHAAAPAPVDRPAANGEAFDRAWERTARVYYAAADGAARRARWEALRDVYRPRALAAGTDEALQEVLHEMWQQRPPLRRPAVGRAAVSSANPVATAAGLEILRRGGNVVDAAVAVSFTLGVVEPDASGVGGYGQMLMQLASLPSPALIEFMTRAPEDAGLANGELRRAGEYPTSGPALANVPGTVAGMYLAWQRYGSQRLPWADLLAPAIRAAESGYVVSDGLATTLRVERERFLEYPGSRALFFPNGVALRAGDTLRNPDLAHTLRAIADSGATTFYRGALARRIVEDLRGHGNAMRLADLERYYAVPRQPVAGTYRGYTVFSSAPPVAGGVTLLAQLNALEHVAEPKPYPDDAPTLHAMIESWKLVPSTRGRIADPGLWPVHTEAFVSKDSASARWRCYRPDRALGPAELGGDSLPCAGAARRSASGGDAPPASGAETSCAEADRAGAGCHQSGTTAFVVADADGNMVAATQTLGTWGGNFYVTPGLGFLYNDKLTSYPDDPDDYGARLPNARHGSSIAPTIVLRGTGAQRRPVLALGAAGNAWITSAVYAIVTGVLDQGLDPQHAVELPRFLLASRRESRDAFTVQVESGMAPAVLARLAALGDEVQPVSLPGELRMGYAAAILMGDHDVVAAADPRRSGTAGAIGCGADEPRDCRIDRYPR